jgi:hypothetical protein
LAGAIAVLVVSIAVTGVGAIATSKASAIEFRPVVVQFAAPAPAISSTTAPIDRAAAAVIVAKCDLVGVAELPEVPTTNWRTARADQCVVYPPASGGTQAPRYYLGPAPTLPIRGATPEFVSGQGWTVRITFTKTGSKAWDQLAERQFHRQVAIAYRGRVVAAPTIEPDQASFASFDGRAVVSGSFTKKEAAALAAAARANGR